MALVIQRIFNYNCLTSRCPLVFPNIDAIYFEFFSINYSFFMYPVIHFDFFSKLTHKVIFALASGLTCRIERPPAIFQFVEKIVKQLYNSIH